mgnify:CR=1 FL=1
MNKVHILTFHNALNYGAILQCYALYTKINEFMSCDVIDYRANAIENRYKIFKQNQGLIDFAKSVFMKKRNYIKRKKFLAFIKNNITTTTPFYNFDELKNHNWSSKDIFCVGSDQVWNWELTKNDKAFTLAFAPAFSRKFSYAASIGLKIDSLHGEKIKKMTQNFSGISVRESSAAKSLNEFGILCTRCIDPVFLLDKEDWIKITHPNRNEDIPYVLMYLLQKDPILANSAMEYAKTHHMRLVIMSTGIKKEFDAEYVVDCSPDEFVRYFYKANTIFTNSFHGISFSILFNKKFYFGYQGNAVKTNSRLQDVINIFHLQSQNIAESYPLSQDIDYIYIEKVICSERDRAVEFILENINDKEA